MRSGCPGEAQSLLRSRLDRTPMGRNVNAGKGKLRVGVGVGRDGARRDGRADGFTAGSSCRGR